MYDALSARLILVAILDSRRDLSLYWFIACCSGVMEPRGGLDARDLASLGGGVKLASEPPLRNEFMSVPRTLLFDDLESKGPNASVRGVVLGEMEQPSCAYQAM